MQTLSVNTARHVNAEDTECSFGLEKTETTADDDLENQMLKNQILQGFSSDNTSA